MESEPGLGSRFHFTARFGVGTTARNCSPASDASRLRGIPVLVVDDNATSRRLLDVLPANWGMQTVSVPGAGEALDAIERACAGGRPFQLVLSDVQMPGVDGISLAAAIRLNPKWDALPILLLTSAGQTSDVARSRELGVQACLTKPVRRAELRAAMLAALGTRTQLDDPMSPVTMPSAGPLCRGLRILVAEDNAINQEVARRLLEKHGHSVTLAATGLEAIGALERQAFDLLLMDVQMPELDGLEATARIRATESATGQHQTIVAMTARAMQEDRERCLSAGMDGYLAKPLNSAELLALLESLASR